MGFFTYIKSAIVGAGTGVSDLAPVQGVNLVPATLYSDKRLVQRQLATQAPAFVKLGNAVVPVSLLGDTGIALQGTFDLTPLAREGN